MVVVSAQERDFITDSDMAPGAIFLGGKIFRKTCSGLL